MAQRDELTFESEVERLLAADPFRPFGLSLTSGQRFRVESPHLVVMGASVITIIEASGLNRIIRRNQVVAIDLKD